MNRDEVLRMAQQAGWDVPAQWDDMRQRAEKAEADAKRWRETLRSAAVEAGESLLADRDALRAEVERLRERLIAFEDEQISYADRLGDMVGQDDTEPLHAAIARVMAEREALRADAERLRSMADHARQFAESFHRVVVKKRDYERQQVDALRADAERYRWLRGEQDDIVVGSHPGAMDYGMSTIIGTYDEWLAGDELDAAIDAARKEVTSEPR